MNTLSAAFFLQTNLNELFAVLVSPSNSTAIKEFAQKLVGRTPSSQWEKGFRYRTYQHLSTVHQDKEVLSLQSQDIGILTAVARLYDNLGHDLFKCLVSFDNVDVVREFAEKLVRSSLPSRMILGDRSYKLVSCLREGEDRVTQQELLDRAQEMEVCGEDEGRYIFDHQKEIPVQLQGKQQYSAVEFVFPDWRAPYNASCMAIIVYSPPPRWRYEKDHWRQWFDSFDAGCGQRKYYVVREK